jgi:hypothetical protein
MVTVFISFSAKFAPLPERRIDKNQEGRAPQHPFPFPPFPFNEDFVMAICTCFCLVGSGRNFREFSGGTMSMLDGIEPVGVSSGTIIVTNQLWLVS